MTRFCSPSAAALALLALLLSPSAHATISGSGDVFAANNLTPSPWDAGAYLFVGDVNDGALNISNGSTVLAELFSIGSQEGAGSVEVSGQGSHLRFGLFSFAGEGNGSLIIRDGGRVSTAGGNGSFVFNGGHDDIEDRVEVRNGGSLHTDDFNFSMGFGGGFGPKTFAVSGGTVTSTNVDVYTGLIDVSAGTWTIANLLKFERRSTGKLLIRNTGSVTVRSVLGDSDDIIDVNGGTLTVTKELSLGVTEYADDQPETKLTINGGSVSVPTAYLGFQNNSIGVVQLNGGDLNVPNMWLGHASGSKGILHLNGGTLTTNRLWGNSLFSSEISTSEVHFDGGTLRLSSAGEIFNKFTAGKITLANRGNTIDTQSFDSSTTYALTGSGSLTKRGSGTLTLSGANTYGGGTIIREGTLTVTGSIYHPEKEVSMYYGGNLTISGGALTSDAGLIGPGTVQVPSGNWTATDRILVGFAGDGSLTISGGRVFTPELSAAGVVAARATVTLSGGVLQTSQVSRGNSLPATFLFNGGTLQLTAHQNSLFTGFAADAISLGAGGGTIDTQAFNATTTVPLSGSGSLTKTGAGNLILGGNNSYTGGTVIHAGSLSIGSGTTGSITGDVVNNANLYFGRSDIHTYAGVISGTGAVGHAHAKGTTILTGDHTYTGGTSVNFGGTLQLGNGGATGSVLGDIVVNGGFLGGPASTLAFNRSGTYTFGGGISGAGAVTQMGPGALILSGAHAYTGATSVNAGRLVVTGSLGATAVAVANGATLGGGGTLGGSLTLVSGARLALGVSPGAISGPTVAGAVTLDGIITVTTEDLGGALAPGTYTVLQASGPISGAAQLVWQAPEGSPLTATFDRSSADRIQILLTIPQTGMESWTEQWFGPDTTAEQAGPQADPDGDGRPNLLEYALGGSPLASDPAMDPVMMPEDGHLSLGFTRVADPTLIYEVEAISSLDSIPWTVIWSSTGTDNVAGPVQVEDPEALGDHPARFLRLRVRMAE